MDAGPAGLVRFDSIAVPSRFVLFVSSNPFSGHAFQKVIYISQIISPLHLMLFITLRPLFIIFLVAILFVVPTKRGRIMRGFVSAVMRDLTN